MNASNLQKFLHFTIANRFPVLIKGKPGIGKSDIVAQAAMDAGAELVISHPVVSDPTDFKGMPYVGKGKADFLPFGELEKIIKADKPTVYFLDDLGQAPASVQAACMQLILARQVNGHKVSDQVTFIAATNRKEDKAGVSGLLEPVKSRFASIVELEVDVNDWVKWALSKGNMPTELISFIRFRPELLSDFKPTKDISNSPCPRTISYIGKMQNAGLPKELMMEAFVGAAGEGFAAEYKGFLDVFQSIPDVDMIFANPDAVEVPVNSAVQYAVCGVIAARINETNADNAFKYIAKMPPELSFSCVKDCMVRSPKVTKTRAFIKWASDNGNLVFG